MPFITANNIKLYYKTYGHGQPLVLISGIKADHQNWLTILDELSKYFEVIVFDNRSTGQSSSPKPGYTIEAMADDVAALIDHLDLKKPHIVGHSLGGTIAQMLAKKYPEKIGKIVLANTFAKFNAVVTLAFENILDLHRTNATAEFILKCILPWGFSSEFLNSPNIVAQILEANSKNPYPQTSIGYEGQFTALCQFDSRDWLLQIKVPTLVIGSEKDILTPMEESLELVTKIHNASIATLPGGNASSVENPEIFINKVKEFLMC